MLRCQKSPMARESAIGAALFRIPADQRMEIKRLKVANDRFGEVSGAVTNVAANQGSETLFQNPRLQPCQIVYRELFNQLLHHGSPSVLRDQVDDRSALTGLATRRQLRSGGRRRPGSRRGGVVNQSLLGQDQLVVSGHTQDILTAGVFDHQRGLPAEKRAAIGAPRGLAG